MQTGSLPAPDAGSATNPLTLAHLPPNATPAGQGCGVQDATLRIKMSRARSAMRRFALPGRLSWRRACFPGPSSPIMRWRGSIAHFFRKGMCRCPHAFCHHTRTPVYKAARWLSWHTVQRTLPPSTFVRAPVGAKRLRRSGLFSGQIPYRTRHHTG